jgi:lipoate-protein ligase A
LSLPLFGFVSLHREPLAGSMAHEAAWLACSAATGQPGAHLWTAPRGLVVPRRTTALPGWAAASADLVHGEVQVRSSGGGAVPQGPGVWNLSLAWPAPTAAPSGADEIYAGLCGALATAFARLGLRVQRQAVQGSFCDGRFNLALGGAKLVGTAQAWRRVAGRPMVLAHAVIVVSAEPEELTARVNAFEAAVGSPVRHQPQAVTSILRGCGMVAADAADIEARTLTALAETFARVVPPRVRT